MYITEDVLLLKLFSRCENIVQEQMNYFQSPNIGINASRNCANSLVGEIEFLWASL